MRDVFNRLTYLNTWSLVDGAVYGGYKTFSRWSLAAGSASRAAGFESL